MILLKKQIQFNYKLLIYFVVGILLLVGLFLVANYNFLLFHVIVELFSIIIAYSIFLIAWNSRNFNENSFLTVLGIAFFFIGSLDLIHTLGYYGMNIFKGFDKNLPTQLWIAARYLESFSFLIIFFIKKEIKYIQFVFVLYTFIFILFLFLIFARIFPDCYIEGSGLTLFKKISEYIISGILVLSIIIIIHSRNDIDNTVKKWMLLSIFLTICSELMFTFYISVYGLSNLIGHYLKIISFYFIYKALIEISLKQPYSGLFKKLYESNLMVEKREKELKIALKEKDILLKEVYHRAKNNMTVISSFLNLQASNIEDKKIQEVFTDAGNRILSMALIQEMLYKTDNLSSIHSELYIRELCELIKQSYQNKSEKVSLEYDLYDIQINSDMGVSLGLIINELVTNSLKYAFTARSNGKIKISMCKSINDVVELSILDNGIGLQDGFNLNNNSNLGLTMVSLVVKDNLSGNFDIKSENGTGCYIKFKLKD